jgi:hypothetical protein
VHSGFVIPTYGFVLLAVRVDKHCPNRQDKAWASQAHTVWAARSYRLIQTQEQAMTINAREIESTLDSRAKSAAAKAGFKAIKSHCRKGSMDNYGHFMLIDPTSNYVVAGARFELSADDVIAYCVKG